MNYIFNHSQVEIIVKLIDLYGFSKDELFQKVIESENQ